MAIAVVKYAIRFFVITPEAPLAAPVLIPDGPLLSEIRLAT
jgi:hypothetical protein